MEHQELSHHEETPSERAERVFAIADAASAILLRYRDQIGAVEYKKDAFDPVTAADRESDVFIRTEIQKAFPEDAILSEEDPTIPEGGVERVWMVDPLNGTKSFIKGTDTFGVVIGLIERGVPVFGCVAVPAQGKLFYAEKGQGAFAREGQGFRKLQAPGIVTISDARLITREPSGDVRPIEEKLDRIPFASRIAEGSGAKLCMIAAGEAEAHVNTNMRAGKWDIAAQQIILEEAGGVVSDLDGKPIVYTGEGVGLPRSFVASANPALHKELMDALVRAEV